MISLLGLLVLGAVQGEGVVLERKTVLVLADTLDRRREIHRKERVKYHGGNLLIEDLTFGERLLIRSDKKTVWKIDSMAGTYSELTFEQVRRRQDEVLGEIRKTLAYVKGTREERETRLLLEAYGRFEKDPPVEIRTPGKSRRFAGRDCVRKELIVAGKIRRLAVYVDPTLPDATGYFETLGRIGAFPPHELARLKSLGGFPLAGLTRSILFLDRVQARDETTSVEVRKISDAEFAPPQGLTRVPLRDFEKPSPRKIKRPKGVGKGFREDDLDQENNPLKEDKKP